MKHRKKRPVMVIILIVLLIFLGIGAVGGGLGFMLAPDGSFMGMPLENLKRTPFSNYFIPGVVLFLCNGVYPFFVAYCIIKRLDWKLATQLNPFKAQHWTWSASLLSGVIVMIWIAVQVSWLGYSSFLQPLYFIYGLVIIGITLLPTVRRYFSL
ncbi:MAG: hypothetical protein JW908_11275 [Anaerolineales bacterium]|nr:hypothetical protein [Anaerolineales bacterium]